MKKMMIIAVMMSALLIPAQMEAKNNENNKAKVEYNNKKNFNNRKDDRRFKDERDYKKFDNKKNFYKNRPT
ncbi:MAG: hypothetical protein J6U89_02410, partial [Bacteroidaceae bacterium]|nr:hypothetical protein [Bacteroidaceae bacterium]